MGIWYMNCYMYIYIYVYLKYSAWCIVIFLFRSALCCWMCDGTWHLSISDQDAINLWWRKRSCMGNQMTPYFFLGFWFLIKPELKLLEWSNSIFMGPVRIHGFYIQLRSQHARWWVRRGRLRHPRKHKGSPTLIALWCFRWGFHLLSVRFDRISLKLQHARLLMLQ